MSLPAILAALELEQDGIRAAVPEGWRQGRTCYGGLSAALALEAARRLAGELPPLRSAQIAFVGPLEGVIAARATVLRRGRNAVFVTSDVSGEAGLGLRATFVFMAPRDSHLDLPAAPIAVSGPPEEARAFPFPPVFAQNFDYRFAAPKTGEADLSCWVRLRERDGLDAVVELLCVGDALPPAALMLFTKLGPISSLDWQINLLTERPATRDGWWLLRSTATHAADGVSSQVMGIWNSDGVQVASAMQAVGLFV